MKRFAIVLLLLLGCALAAPCQENNDFYDNTSTRALPCPKTIEVTGEVANPGPVDLRQLSRHSLITRETRLKNGQLEFIGAFRYDGYSLFDILKEKPVAKKNKAEFGPVIDLLVKVENAKGEAVVISWGEIYYPSAPHRILLADRVAPIVPSESKDEWPLPERSKLVCGNDLVTERNVSEPVKVTVFSAPQSFKTVKGLKPLYASAFKLFIDGQEKEFAIPLASELRVFPTVFYGRGKGFHGIQRFAGILMCDVLKPAFTRDSEQMRRGYFVIAATDGYRIAVTYSELMNRNDHAEFLLLDRGVGQDGGRFTLYPASDFFSDRAIKAIASIHYQSI